MVSIVARIVLNFLYVSNVVIDFFCGYDRRIGGNTQRDVGCCRGNDIVVGGMQHSDTSGVFKEG